VNYLVMFTLLRYRCTAVVHILIHSVNLAFGPKSGFKHNCQVRAFDFGFKLQIEDRSQLWVAGHLHFDKGLQFCFMADFNKDYIRILIFCQNKIDFATLKQMTKDARLNQWKPKIS